MKEPKEMEELHKIMEKFYEEDKDLSPEQKVKKNQRGIRRIYYRTRTSFKKDKEQTTYSSLVLMI